MTPRAAAVAIRGAERCQGSMRFRRGWVAFVLGAALMAAGCASPTRSASFPTEGSLPAPDEGTARRPDGISPTRAGAPPPPVARVLSTAPVGTLRAPLGLDRAEATVATFFDAVAREDVHRLARTLTSTAVVRDPRADPSEPAPLVLSQWRQRFSKFDYARLAQGPLYRAGDLETFRSGERDRLPVGVRELAPKDGRAVEIVLRAEVLAPTLDGARAFGPELFFWLAPAEGRFAIVQVAERFPP
ncbi:MAG: hypothetical protein AAGN82_02390 [Myxococcota bacterium]